MGRGVLRLCNVSKRFRRGLANDSLRDLIATGLHRLRLGRGPRQDDAFWALKDVSFEVKPGQAVGVIGPNGAGKSTALRLMAGILRPDEGSVEAHGRLSALIDVGAGFHGDLTGRENIYLNGAILGMRRHEIDKKLEQIVAFSGIEEFIDTPVKRYSSGMQARLGFSVAAHVDPDILLVDEVLSVGDVAFRQRCVERMREMLRLGVTLLFVTHNLEQMQEICTRTVVLDHGKLTFFGDRREAVERYLAAMHVHGRMGCPPGPKDLGHPPGSEGDSPANVLDVRFLDRDGRECVCVRPDEPLQMEIYYSLARPVTRLVVAANMRRHLGEHFVNFNSGRDACTFDAPAGNGCVRILMTALPVAGGQYYWNVRLWDHAQGVCLVETPFRFPLVVEDDGRHTGMLCIEHSWSRIESNPTEPQAPARGIVQSTRVPS
ncbi:MAG: ABC transporter ATP-binding protein [Planctomycetes bacterium]|nr:ABC transporter ATP-binding protein [Planctomycetota bacterium]